MLFLNFLAVRVSGKSFLNGGLEYCWLGCAVIGKSSEPSFQFFADLCLEKKEEIFGEEASAWCLPSGISRGEGVGRVVIGRLLWMGDNSLLVLGEEICWRMAHWQKGVECVSS